MTPSTAKKGVLQYRYYVSSVLAQGRASEAGSVKRVPADEIETVVVGALRARFGTELADRLLVTNNLERVVVGAGHVELTLHGGEATSIPWSKPASGRREIIAAPGQLVERPMRAEARVVLLRSIALGRRWLDQIVRGKGGLDTIATREGRSKRHVERTIALAFLAPDLVKAIAQGRLPRGVNATALADASSEWSKQWQILGLGSVAQ
jgi:hypothetical protein